MAKGLVGIRGIWRILFVLLLWAGFLEASPYDKDLRARLYPKEYIHSISLLDIPKYKNDFKHFDYVNVNAPKRGRLKGFALGGFDSLNPFLLKGNPADELSLIYDTLMSQSLDEPYSQYPLIADGLKLANDHSGVIFHINPKAYFSDGIKVSAWDVKFSFDTLIEKGSVIFAQYYAGIKEARVLDDEHIEFIFKSKDNPELPMILGQLTILPRHFYMKDGKNTFGQKVLDIPIGSGPYVVQSYEINRYITYKRNKNYWAKDLAVNIGTYNFDLIQIDYYKDASVALKAFLKGDYDWRFENVAKVWARGYESSALKDGKIAKVMLENAMPSGMQGFFLNTRRDVLKDPLVREALLYAFDVDWAIKNLFYSQYAPTQSYFDHSIYAMKNGVVSGKEREKLLKYKDKLDAKDRRILHSSFKIPRTYADDLKLRENLKYAMSLLKKAGYEIRDFRLVDKKSKKPFELTLLLDNAAFDRLALSYAQNLKILGIRLRIEKVDSARYGDLVRNFDYDMIVGVVPQSLYPGNEQRYYFGSKAANIKGSKNYAGISDEVVDDLIERLIKSHDYQDRLSLVRALDRVLSWGFYVIPHFYMPAYRIAYWKHIKMPEKSPPYGLNPYIWWDENLGK